METKIWDYFESETMPEDCARRIEDALTTQSKPAVHLRRVWAAAMAAALALVVLIGVNFNTLKVYAEELYDWIVHPIDEGIERPIGKGEDGIYYGYADDATYELSPDGKISHASSTNRNGADVIRVTDGRMYFIANKEQLDITDLCSEETAFVYALEDKSKILHYFIVGGTPDDWGYEEIIANPGDDPTHPRMIGSQGLNTFRMDEDLNFIDCPWLADGYAKIGFPDNFS